MYQLTSHVAASARARDAAVWRAIYGMPISPETRLTLTEFLLGCEDVVACAQYALDWLEQHAGISRALCAVSVSGDPHLSGVAGIGISAARTCAFEIDPLGGDPLSKVVRTGTSAP